MAPSVGWVEHTFGWYDNEPVAVTMPGPLPSRGGQHGIAVATVAAG